MAPLWKPVEAPKKRVEICSFTNDLAKGLFSQSVQKWCSVKTGNMGYVEKGDPQQIPHEARTLTTKEKTTRNVYSTSVRSAALPGTEASNFNYTYRKILRKTTEGTGEKTRGTQAHRRVIREWRRSVRREWRRRVRREGLGARGGPELLVLCLWPWQLPTSVAAGTNQHLPRADLAPSPCCAWGLHLVCAPLSPGKRVPRSEGSAALL